MPSMALASYEYILYIDAGRPADAARRWRVFRLGTARWPVDQPERSGLARTYTGEFIEYGVDEPKPAGQRS